MFVGIDIAAERVHCAGVTRSGHLEDTGLFAATNSRLSYAGFKGRR